MVFGIMMALLLALSLGLHALTAIGSLFSMDAPATTRTHRQGLIEVVVENNRSDNKIVVIDVAGIITGEPFDARGNSIVSHIDDQLERAGEDDDVQAVVLRVDSPGGEVLASDDIYKLIENFQDEYGKPVIASMSSVAASGGYYVSAPCRWIVANELTITGSIGVIMHGYNYRGLMDKIGIRPEVYKSGKFKNMMSGDRLPEEVPAEERQMMQAMIDETFQKFKTVVEEGRTAAKRANKSDGRALVSDWEDYADGRILTGKQAYQLGFVDELGDDRTAVDRAMEIAGISDANLVGYHLPFEFSNLFRLFGETESRAVKVDLGIDLPKIRAGRTYFLWLPQ